MNYFKLISNGTFIGVASGGDFRKFQHKHRVMLSCSEDDAQYVQYGDVYYHAGWMKPVKDSARPYEEADVIRIEKEEYDALRNSIESGEEIVLVAEPDPTIPERPATDPNETLTLEYVIESKIKEMSASCNAAIISGMDVVLSDGESHHFSLRFSDQVNIIMLYNKAMIGEEALPYHADDAIFKTYSKEDVLAIYDGMTSTVLWNNAYFNSLKAYIKSMTDIEKVSGVVYGTKIPRKYQSEVLKSLTPVK